MNSDNITGYLKYNNVEFTFVFYDKLLKLIPLDNESNSKEEFYRELNSWEYLFDDHIRLDLDSLIGICNESKKA